MFVSTNEEGSNVDSNNFLKEIDWHFTSCEGSLGTGDKKLCGHGSFLAFPKMSPGSTRRKPAAYLSAGSARLYSTALYCSKKDFYLFSVSSLHCVVACSCSSIRSFFKVQMASKEHCPQKY